MHNPFERDSLRWHLFNELCQSLTEDERITPLELVKIVDNLSPEPDNPPPRELIAGQQHLF